MPASRPTGLLRAGESRGLRREHRVENAAELRLGMFCRARAPRVTWFLVRILDDLGSMADDAIATRTAAPLVVPRDADRGARAVSSPSRAR